MVFVIFYQQFVLIYWFASFLRFWEASSLFMCFFKASLPGSSVKIGTIQRILAWPLAQGWHAQIEKGRLFFPHTSVWAWLHHRHQEFDRTSHQGRQKSFHLTQEIFKEWKPHHDRQHQASKLDANLPTLGRTVPIHWIPFGDYPLKLERYRED